MFSALVSSATGKPVAANLAMTGEITTLGEVISIGGVREKLTACKNHNITRVVLPLSNRKHVKKLPEEFKNLDLVDPTFECVSAPGTDPFRKDQSFKLVRHAFDLSKT